VGGGGVAANGQRAPRIRPFIFWSSNKVISQSLAACHNSSTILKTQGQGRRQKGI
jgi:hypothetical protein